MVGLFDEIARMQAEMDEVFSRFSERRPLLTGGKEIAVSRMPVTNVHETESSIVASFELPGVEKEDIDVNVNEDSIEVRVQKREKKEERKEGSYRYSEMSRSFYRNLPLPKSIKPNEAKATFRNGLLRIEAPKSEKEEKRQKLRVE